MIQHSLNYYTHHSLDPTDYIPRPSTTKYRTVWFLGRRPGPAREQGPVEKLHDLMPKREKEEKKKKVEPSSATKSRDDKEPKKEKKKKKNKKTK